MWVEGDFLCGKRLAQSYISLLVDHDTEEELWHLLRDVMFIHKTASCPRLNEVKGSLSLIMRNYY